MYWTSLADLRLMASQEASKTTFKWEAFGDGKPNFILIAGDHAVTMIPVLEAKYEMLAASGQLPDFASEDLESQLVGAYLLAELRDRFLAIDSVTA